MLSVSQDSHGTYIIIIYAASTLTMAWRKATRYIYSAFQAENRGFWTASVA